MNSYDPQFTVDKAGHEQLNNCSQSHICEVMGPGNSILETVLLTTMLNFSCLQNSICPVEVPLQKGGY